MRNRNGVTGVIGSHTAAVRRRAQMREIADRYDAERHARALEVTDTEVLQKGDPNPRWTWRST